jgi:hypothetical protein
VTVVETLLTFVVAPGVLYGGMALVISARRRGRRPRYRVGDPWPYEPLFWTANPEGAHLPAGTAGGDTRGGTGGTW